MFNVFNDAAVPLLFYNLERDLWSTSKVFIFLNRIPEYPRTEITDIEEDSYCLQSYTQSNGYDNEAKLEKSPTNSVGKHWITNSGSGMSLMDLMAYFVLVMIF